MKSVDITEAKYLLLDVSTNTSSPSFWHMKSVHITEAKVLLLYVTTTSLNPSFWHHDVSTRDWGIVSTARGLYYYIESQYLTHEVSTYHRGQVSTAKGQYNYIVSKYLTHEVSRNHWDQGSTARGQYFYIESQYLTPWCQHTWLRQSFYCWRYVLLHWVPVFDNWSKYLFLRPSSTARGQYNYIGSNFLTHEVSTHHWGQVSTARGQYYYIESLYDVSTHP